MMATDPLSATILLSEQLTIIFAGSPAADRMRIRFMLIYCHKQRMKEPNLHLIRTEWILLVESSDAANILFACLPGSSPTLQEIIPGWLRSRRIISLICCFCSSAEKPCRVTAEKSSSVIIPCLSASLYDTSSAG